MALDFLVFGPHPDDIEILCAGTLAKYKARRVDTIRASLQVHPSTRQVRRPVEAVIWVASWSFIVMLLPRPPGGGRR